MVPSPQSDPFADPNFLSRLQKLLSMLASEQPGEADAARRKLMEHLAQHRLSLTDVANRLRDPAPATRDPAGAALERALHIARRARAEAEAEAEQANRRVVQLQIELQRAAIDAGRARGRPGQLNWPILAVGGATTLGIVLLAWMQFAVPRQLPHQAMAQDGPVTLRAPDPLAEPDFSGLARHGNVGAVAVQDLAVRLSPSDTAGIRAFLNRGTRVLIEETTQSGVQTWLLIRSGTGSGWVRGGDIIR